MDIDNIAAGFVIGLLTGAMLISFLSINQDDAFCQGLGYDKHINEIDIRYCIDEENFFNRAYYKYENKTYSVYAILGG